MNLVDLLLSVIILFCVYTGYLKGFITGTIQLLILAASLLSAFFLYPYIAAFLDHSVPSLGIWKIPISFIAAVFIARIILSIIANYLLSAISERVQVHPVNHLLGIVPGGINGLIWVIIVAAVLLSVPFSGRLSLLARDSKIAGKMTDQVDFLDEKVAPFLDDIVNVPFGKTALNENGEHAVSLPFKDNDPKVREDLEAKMLDLVNNEREKAGLNPLKFDAEMLVVARAHSKDMFARGYFSHETPEGLSPFDRMKKAKVRFLAAGENLALGQTLTICHRGLMNSPGHRKNILNPAFGRVGIGILDGGIYGLMITQNFRN